MKVGSLEPTYTIYSVASSAAFAVFAREKSNNGSPLDGSKPVNLKAQKLPTEYPSLLREPLTALLHFPLGSISDFTLFVLPEKLAPTLHIKSFVRTGTIENAKSHPLLVISPSFTYMLDVPFSKGTLAEVITSVVFL